VWEVVRDAREAAVSAVREAAAAGRPIAGYEGDRAARGTIEAAGYGEWFVHRTGHSIDLELHGSGPHLDDYETHDDRRLVPGVGFSVEPGIYLPGRFGVRSEVNMYWGPGGPEVTPRVPQTELIVAGGAAGG
jgi:Xaa-Pro aminopeptidase